MTFDRDGIEQALATERWSDAARTLRDRAAAQSAEAERWRFDALAACARVLASGARGRDAAAQIREFARLAEGHVRIPGRLLASAEGVPWSEFAAEVTGEAEGWALVALCDRHPLFDVLPCLPGALAVDPALRRNVAREPADAFLLRLSSHDAYSSDAQKAMLRAIVTAPPGATLVASLPTGWGKSTAFQVGARWWREADPAACAIVVTPTVALAQDHVRSMSAMPGLEATRALVGGMSEDARRAALEDFRAGKVPVLLLSPEMALDGAAGLLRDVAARGAAGHHGGHLGAVFVDEAHIIASWGRHFRPDFQRLCGFVRELREAQPALRTILLSATLDEDLRAQLKEDFGTGSHALEVAVGEPRTEFDFFSRAVSPERRAGLVLRAVDVLPRPAVVYTTKVEDAEKLHADIVARGYDRVELFTGQLDDAQDRERIIRNWADGNLDLVVATSAFGMGVDKENVRAVMHACLPEGPDRLYQEIGRGGRDGHQALALALWTEDDLDLAVSMATHGWMSVDMAARRWLAIVRRAEELELVRPSPAGETHVIVDLDSRHDELPQVTGRKNRQWNMTLLAQLQRARAIRILALERGARRFFGWRVEILDGTILERTPAAEATVRRHLSLTGEEVSRARSRLEGLEDVLRNEDGACLLASLFLLVEPGSEPWPCGRCEACREAGESSRPSCGSHSYSSPWEDAPVDWARDLREGPTVVTPEDPGFSAGLGKLVGRLAALGIQQVLAPENLERVLPTVVAAAGLLRGFVGRLGGKMAPVRMPTAVLVPDGTPGKESLREACMALRRTFAGWPELPLLFVMSSDVKVHGIPLCQHVSAGAPVAERDLESLRKNA